MTDTVISLYYPFLFSFSLSLLLPSVINIFKKSMHSILSFTTTTTITTTTTESNNHGSISGLGLVTATEDVDSVPNVLESTNLKPNANGGNSIRPAMSIGFIGGHIDGLMSCTESLGFESSDERRVDDKTEIIHNEKVNDDDDDNDDGDSDNELWRRKLLMKRAESRDNWRKVRSFPPPLSSLNRNGKPSFYLRPVRKDGRLELTEVRIHRPEILHASRHDGRLTLHLIPDQFNLEEEEEEDEDEEEEEEEEEEQEKQELVQEEKEQELVVEEEEEEEEKELVVKEEEEEGVVEEIRCEKEDSFGEWGFVGGGGCNEGFRRCHEMVNQHHHRVHANHHNHLQMCGISIV